MAKKHPKKPGRKWFDGKEIAHIKKLLEEAYSNALPFTEVVLYCGVSDRSLRRYLKANEGFRLRLQALRNSQNITARGIIAKALKEGDTTMARWWLEHKDEEFKRQGTTKKASVELSKGRDGEIKRINLVLVETRDKAHEFNETRNQHSDNEGI